MKIILLTYCGGIWSLLRLHVSWKLPQITNWLSYTFDCVFWMINNCSSSNVLSNVIVFKMLIIFFCWKCKCIITFLVEEVWLLRRMNICCRHAPCGAGANAVCQLQNYVKEYFNSLRYLYSTYLIWYWMILLICICDARFMNREINILKEN